MPAPLGLGLLVTALLAGGVALACDGAGLWSGRSWLGSVGLALVAIAAPAAAAAALLLRDAPLRARAALGAAAFVLALDVAHRLDVGLRLDVLGLTTLANAALGAAAVWSLPALDAASPDPVTAAWGATLGPEKDGKKGEEGSEVRTPSPWRR